MVKIVSMSSFEFDDKPAINDKLNSDKIARDLEIILNFQIEYSSTGDRVTLIVTGNESLSFESYAYAADPVQSMVS